ncbi:MAG: hypothetical protein K0U84_03790 [Actinomycetia bacterium]|nr:hypothetical protein [Actinomycetes bacterium]
METIPRTAGAVAGVILMYAGHSAIMGPIGSFSGMIAALALSTIWIIWETRQAGAESRRLQSLGKILVLNRTGIASAIGSAAYVAAPLAIVSVVAPTIQSTFAMADRVKGLISIASAPVTKVLQGWVPRGTESTRVRRANIAIASASMLGILLGVGTMISTQSLVSWLGNGQISVSWGVALLLSACVSITLFRSVLERAVLATFEQLHIVAKAIAAGSIVGLPLVGVGAHQLGTVGALGGVLAGLLVCVVVELFGLFRFLRFVK